MRNVNIFEDYENAVVDTVESYRAGHPGTTYKFSEIPNREIDGIPISVTRAEDGELEVTFIPDGHLLAIGATRSGKTTGYVLPTINVLMRKKNKPSLILSDPKQELYNATAKGLEAEGYNVKIIDFTNDYRYSDCWNPLTKIFRLYQRYLHVEDEVSVVRTGRGYRNRFRDVTYENQKTLDLAIAEVKTGLFDEVEKNVTALTAGIIPVCNTKDPFWEVSALDMLRSILYAMLEDSESGLITEETFSFDTVVKVFDSFSDSNSPYDNGYFTHRDLEKSKAYQLAQKCFLEQASNTRRCIASSFASKANIFRDTAIRRVTSNCSFEMSELDGDRPTAVFLSYKDEENLHYDVISMFLSNLYTELIGISRKKGKPLSRPFYFLLDEFGNLPKFGSFDKVISACGARNVWFLIVLQSYAQLYNIYGKETAEIIKDNLNTHVFFGTNNPQTKQEFSDECGKKTIIAPTSALNGSGESINRYDKETVPLVPVSALSKIEIGTCYVTQMRENVLLSRMERSYTCPEFQNEPASIKDRTPTVNFADPKYSFVIPKYNTARRHAFDFD